MKTKIAIFYTEITFTTFLKINDVDDYKLYLHKRVSYEKNCSRFSTNNIRNRHLFYKDLSSFLKHSDCLEEIVFHNSTDISLQLLFSSAAFNTLKWTYVYDGIGSIYYMPETVSRALFKGLISYFYLGTYKPIPFNFMGSYNVDEITELVPDTVLFVSGDKETARFDAFVIIGNTDLNYNEIIEELNADCDDNVKRYFVKHPLENTREIEGFESLSFKELLLLINKQRVFIVSEISTAIFDLVNNPNVTVCVARRCAHHVDYQMRYFNVIKKVKGVFYDFYFLC